MNQPFIYSLYIFGHKYPSSPLGVDKIKFIEEKERDQMFTRVKLSGKLTYTGKDFDLLMLLQNSSDRCAEIGVLVESTNFPGMPDWKGYFSLNDCDFDEDKRTIEIEPSIDDKYRPILDSYGKEHNILENMQLYYLSAEINLTSSYEYKIGLEEHVVDGWKKLMTYELRFPYNFVLFRETKITNNDGADLVSPPGSGWKPVDFFLTSTRWVREPQLIGAPFYFPNLNKIGASGGSGTGAASAFYMHWNDSNIPANPPPGSVLLDNSFEIYQDNPFPIGYRGIWSVWWNPTDFKFDRNRGLMDTVRFLGKKIDGVNSFDQIPHFLSEFFSADTNYVTGEVNQVKNLLIAQKTDIKDSKSTEAATKGMISLKSLLDELKVIFGVYWFLNYAGEFRLEHRTFFEGAGTIDLTEAKYADFMEGQAKYNYQKEKMPRYEKLVFTEALGEDFKMGTIEYTGICVNYKEGEDTKEITATKIVTDVRSLVTSPDDFSNVGFALLTYDVLTGKIRNEAGDITSEVIPNGHLSAANLLIHYHNDNRSLHTGLRNGKQSTFSSVIKTKKQTILSIPAFWPFDYDAIFITALSEGGELERLEYSPRNNTFRLTILHDGTNNNGPAPLGKQFNKSYNQSFS